MHIKSILYTLVLLSFTNVHAADVVEFTSKNKNAALIELYSSQGCSSCTPAERWISKFVDDDSLWKVYVPIVFHVDYWDYLGWKDPFSTPNNSKRQRNYYQQGKVSSVYTPGFIVNGREWRPGKALPINNNDAVLMAALSENNLKVNYSDKGDYDLHVSILGFDHETDVKRGENRNKKLKENFISLAHKKINSKDSMWNFKLPKINKFNGNKLALAIWVSHKNQNAPLQVVGGWLPGTRR